MVSWSEVYIERSEIFMDGGIRKAKVLKWSTQNEAYDILYQKEVDKSDGLLMINSRGLVSEIVN